LFATRLSIRCGDLVSFDDHDRDRLGKSAPGQYYNSMNERQHEIAVIRALGPVVATVNAAGVAGIDFIEFGGGLSGWL